MPGKGVQSGARGDTLSSMVSLPFGEQCSVHVNLHRQAQGLPHFAITVGGKVVGYARSGEIELEQAEPRIACGTYKRSRTAGAGGKPKRAVFARIVGILRPASSAPIRATVHLHPDRGAHFTVGKGGPRWNGSRRVRFVGGVVGVVA